MDDPLTVARLQRAEDPEFEAARQGANLARSGSGLKGA
jgi:hypothetical protein